MCVGVFSNKTFYSAPCPFSPKTGLAPRVNSVGKEVFIGGSKADTEEVVRT